MPIHIGTVNRKTSKVTTIRIPKKLADELGLEHGESVRISKSESGNEIIIRRHHSKMKQL